MMKREEVLEIAKACVCGVKEKDYGSPEDNFARISEMWTSYMRGRCVAQDAAIAIRPSDVAAMMALLKIARIAGGNSRPDNWVDLAGYAACGGEMEA